MGDPEVIHNYLNLITDKEGFIDYDVKILGTTGKGDGFLSNVVFITITGKTKSEDSKTLNLVAKISSSNKVVREKIPIRKFFLKEIYIYEQVIPAFKDFENKIGVKKTMLDFLSDHVLTVRRQNQEIIFLHNLKSHGFTVWNRIEMLSYNHIKLVLEAFGKWHAFSFALKQKQPDVFGRLLDASQINMWPQWAFQTQLQDVLLSLVDDVKNVCKNEEEIANNLKITKDDVIYILTKLYDEDPDHQVIIHGDCWTNNFLFKNEKETDTPTNVCFIDFQMSGYASPVTDLSFFIYTCLDTSVYKDVKDLLDVYYQNLSDSLLQLGCSNAVFPYDTLIDHWKRFSHYGLILGNFVLKVALAEGGEVPDFAEPARLGRDVCESFVFDLVKNEKLYYDRMRHSFLHYVRNLSITC